MLRHQSWRAAGTSNSVVWPAGSAKRSRPSARSASVTATPFPSVTGSTSSPGQSAGSVTQARWPSSWASARKTIGPRGVWAVSSSPARSPSWGRTSTFSKPGRAGLMPAISM